ncbi:MAG: hypothetical protein R3E58_12855 [Phycisphaerae bacterium]
MRRSLAQTRYVRLQCIERRIAPILSESKIVTVTEAAIQTIDGQHVVFVPADHSDNAFIAKPVTIGETVGGPVPVISGLREGESYVAAGSFVLKAELGKRRRTPSLKKSTFYKKAK